MNIISFVLGLVAIIVFAARWKGAPGGHLGLGLALVTAAWMVQTIWITTVLVSVG